MFERIYPQFWMSLKPEVKKILIEAFEIKRGGVTEVRDDVVLSDGYRVQDLQVITVDAMRAWVGEEAKVTFAQAWDLVMKKIEFILNPPVEVPVVEEVKKNDTEIPLTGVITVDQPVSTGAIVIDPETELSTLTVTTPEPIIQKETSKSHAKKSKQN